MFVKVPYFRHMTTFSFSSLGRDNCAKSSPEASKSYTPGNKPGVCFSKTYKKEAEFMDEFGLFLLFRGDF